MSKKLVRIDIDVWGDGLTTKEWPITREAGGTVYYEGQQRETRFNRFDIGKIYSSRPGTKRIYLVSEAQRPIQSPEVRGAIGEMCDIICRELSNAGRLLADIEHKEYKNETQDGIQTQVRLGGASTSRHIQDKNSDGSEQAAVETFCGSKYQSIMF